MYFLSGEPMHYLSGVDSQTLEPRAVLENLREISGEVEDLIRTGWSMFYPFTREEIAPYFHTDQASGLGETDFVQTTLLRDKEVSRPDMWRVSPDGKTTLIREYWEDDRTLNEHWGVTPGTWISPNWTARNLAEFVRHARGMAERFAAPTTVSFRIEWHGLSGRGFYSPSALWHFSDYVARSDRRIATGSFPVTMLKDRWPEIVAALIAPLIRTFSTEYTVSASWISGQAPMWLRF
jgi:hypothetical protein